MIKFFRKIRQNLLSEGKTGKYLKYAIGEIVLVVIGILIALSINNWNESKKFKIKEKEALSEIISDLETNILELKRLLNGEEWNISTTISSIDFLIGYLEADNVYHDSINLHFNYANQYEELNLKTSGYESITSSGIDIILDSKIRSKIGEYYSSTIEKPKIAYSEVRDDYYHYMLDYLRNDFFQSFNKTLNTTLITPRNYIKLKEKTDYIESLKVFYDVNLYYRSELNKAMKGSRNLKKEVENYTANE